MKKYKLVEAFLNSDSDLPFTGSPISYFGSTKDIMYFLNYNNINATKDAEIIDTQPIKHYSGVKIRHPNLFGHEFFISISGIDVTVYTISVYSEVKTVFYFSNIVGLKINGSSIVNPATMSLWGNQNFTVKDDKINCILGYVVKSKKIGIYPTIEDLPFIKDILGDDYAELYESYLDEALEDEILDAEDDDVLDEF